MPNPGPCFTFFELEIAGEAPTVILLKYKQYVQGICMVKDTNQYTTSKGLDHNEGDERVNPIRATRGNSKLQV